MPPVASINSAGDTRGCEGGAAGAAGVTSASSMTVGAASAAPAVAGGRAYWRSLDELLDTPAFRELVHNEFPAGASEMLGSAERRGFLKVMGASMALAGITLAGCRRWPQEKIAPYAHRPEDRTPGVPEFFATAWERAGVACGLLVTSFDGRPTKVEGNPEHPVSQGSTDAPTQASVLDLYDPDRSQSVLHQGQKSSWSEFAAWAGAHSKELRGKQGRGLAILCHASLSPSLLDMKARLVKAMPEAQWHEYEPLNNDNELQGSILAFGSPQRTHMALDQAKVIVSLDADFMTAHGAAVKNIRDFAAGRRLSRSTDSMSRLYVFESGCSVTGANADNRFALRSADVCVIAARLATALGAAPGDGLAALHGAAVAGWESAALEKALAAVVDDLKTHRGASVVIAGPRQPSAVHLLAHMLNSALGNVGKTVWYTPLSTATGHVESIKALASAMSGGSVQTLVILDSNPVYSAPADLDFTAVMKKAGTVVHLGLYADETGAASTWHVPQAHYLEAWGDGRAYDGTVSITQPLIEPLFGGKSAIELLAALTGDEKTAGYDIVRRTFEEFTGSMQFEVLWRRTLHDGLFLGSAWAATSPKLASSANASKALADLASGWSSAPADRFEIVFPPDNKVGDGRGANNGWLQEQPDALTKLTWDNAVIMSYGAAQRLQVKTGDMVRVTIGTGAVGAPGSEPRSIDGPALVLPGHFDGSVTLPLGYGRTFKGRICEKAGFDVYPLRTSLAMGFAAGATVQKTGEVYPLALTQDHHTIDVESVGGQGAAERLPTLFREADLDDYRKHPDFASHRVHVVHRLSLWEENQPFHSGDGQIDADYAWAMSIDLGACVGCGACIVACQAENNIPVVGKDQVIRGREMHWIRIDRYFRFKPVKFDSHGQAKAWDPATVEAVALQPVPCMHCENAPCEQVCPVAATVHDRDGLNVMVYNRCVGTRYCSNNCPYKVRRFNYFDFQVREPVRESGVLHVESEYYLRGQSDSPPLRRLQFNPEVTVRSRGVMEKCTYCVQRLTTAKIKAKNAWVATEPAQRPARPSVADGDITPACAQACPAKAIVFGDLKNPHSAIVKEHRHERSYSMLEEINTKSRTKYMARVRNPHPDLASRPDHGGPAHPEGGQHG